MVHLSERGLRALQRFFDVVALGNDPICPLILDQWILRAGVKLRADRSRPLDVTGGFRELVDSFFHSFRLLRWRRGRRVLARISLFMRYHTCVM